MTELRLPTPKEAGQLFEEGQTPTRTEVSVAKHYVLEIASLIRRSEKAAHLEFEIPYQRVRGSWRSAKVEQIIIEAARDSGWRCELKWEIGNHDAPIGAGRQYLLVKLAVEASS